MYHDLVDLVQEALGIAYVFEHVGGEYDIAVAIYRRWYAVIQINLHELGDPSSYTRSFDDVDTVTRCPSGSPDRRRTRLHNRGRVPVTGESARAIE